MADPSLGLLHPRGLGLEDPLSLAQPFRVPPRTPGKASMWR